MIRAAQVADHVIGQHRYRETSGDGMPVIADLNTRCAPVSRRALESTCLD